MSTIKSIVTKLKKEWGQPREVADGGSSSPFRLACKFDIAPVKDEDVRGLAISVTPELLDFWQIASSALLFVDVQYGQWGVHVLSPEDAIKYTNRYIQERAKDVRKGDFVIGAFRGDSDLLLLRCDNEADDFGCVMVALPIDSREEWPVVARSFSQYLEMLMQAQGGKYWE